jgi:RNA polymerase sigma-70 factor (sigma-E family)
MELFHGCSASLLRTAYLMVGDGDLAQDLVQETFARAWPRRRRLAEMDAPVAYLRRILINLAIKERRRAGRGVPVAEIDTGTARDLAEQVSDRADLAAVLLQLPTRQRATIILRYFHDLTEADAAAVLGCSVGTVKSQTSRALATLRELLTDHDLDAAETGGDLT